MAALQLKQLVHQHDLFVDQIMLDHFHDLAGKFRWFDPEHLWEEAREEDEDVYWEEVVDEQIVDHSGEDLIQFLGAGAYGRVFEWEYDCTKAVKIGVGDEGNGDIYSDGWLLFAAWLLKHNSQGEYPNLPKVHALVVHSRCYVALLDKHPYSVHNLYYDHGLMDFCCTLALDKMRAFRTGCRTYERLDESEYENKQVARTYFEVARRIMEDLGLENATDLHDDNFMVSENGDPILIDPVGYSHSNAEVEGVLTQLGLV